MRLRVLAIGLVMLATTSAGAMTSHQRATLDAIRAACHADIYRFCRHVPAGGGAIAQCLRGHWRYVSPTCRDELRAVRAARRY